MEEKPFTIESFYEFCNQGKLMGAKCLKCGKIHIPPKPSCTKCGSTKFEWTKLGKTGKITSYTIIYVAPPRFADKTPYAVGIIELDDGVKIPGMIKNVEFNKLKVGMKVKVEFEEAVEKEEWPKWTRYYFTPI